MKIDLTDNERGHVLTALRNHAEALQRSETVINGMIYNGCSGFRDAVNTLYSETKIVRGLIDRIEKGDADNAR